MAALCASGSLAGGLLRFASSEQSPSSSLNSPQIRGTPLTAAAPRLSFSAKRPVSVEKIVCRNSSATQPAVSSSVSGIWLSLVAYYLSVALLSFRRTLYSRRLNRQFPGAIFMRFLLSCDV